MWKERETNPADRRLSNPIGEKKLLASPQELKRKLDPSSSPSSKKQKSENITHTIITSNETEQGQLSEEEEEEILSGYVPHIEISFPSHSASEIASSPLLLKPPQSPLHKPPPSPLKSPKLLDISQKTNLTKQTSLFIPLPPPLGCIVLGKTDSDDEAESPIEDLTVKRYTTTTVEDEILEEDESSERKRNTFWDVI
jgi:hypothetical protein